MDRLQRKISEDILQLTCFDVLFHDLFHRPVEILAAQRALIVGEFDHRDGCILPAKRRSPADVDENALSKVTRLGKAVSGSRNEPYERKKSSQRCGLGSHGVSDDAYDKKDAVSCWTRRRL